MPESLPPPILVLSPPGTPGATVAAALGRGPASFGLPELNLDLTATVDALLRELSGFRAPQLHGLLRALALLLTGEQTGAAVEAARRWLTRRAWMPTEEVAREVAGLMAPRRLVAPVGAALFDPAAMRRLHAAFPDAAWVRLRLHPFAHGHLLARDPAAEAVLLLTGSVDESTDPPTPDAQELWLFAEAAADAALADVPAARQAALRVEALAADPDAALAALAAALGLPADADALAAMRRPELSPFAGPGPLGAALPSPILALDALAAALPATPRLAGPLPWREDAAGFRPEVRERAESLGYA